MVDIECTKLVKHLRQMVRKSKTGSILITHNNRSAVIALQDGEIISLSYGRLRGMAAANEIQKIQACNFSENDLVLGRANDHLPSTAEIVDILANKVSRAAEMSDTALPEATGNVDATQAVKVIEQLLCSYLGPIAPGVIEDCRQQYGAIANTDNLRKFVIIVAHEIPDKSESSQFLSDIKEQLKI